MSKYFLKKLFTEYFLNKPYNAILIGQQQDNKEFDTIIKTGKNPILSVLLVKADLELFHYRHREIYFER